jgi:RimJ/RimL family protein N-acetyltransferase
MKLDALTQDDVLEVLEWRNDERQFLRTPYFITEDMQDDFYHDVVCNRNSQHRYFAIARYVDYAYDTYIDDDDFERELIGMGGITNIDWVNSTGEISLIINPAHRREGLGMESVKLLVTEGKLNMGLKTIWGEVYTCGNVAFWQKVVEQFGGYATKLPNRKLWQGHYYDSMWFAL